MRRTPRLALLAVLLLTISCVVLPPVWGQTGGASITLTLGPNPVAGELSATGLVTLNAPAPAGGMVITLTSGNPVVTMLPGSVSVAAGGSSALFTVTTSPVTITTPVAISAATGGATTTVTLTVLPAVTALALTPTSVLGGSPVSGRITLSGPAPAGGLVVQLASDNTAAATVPASVIVPATTTTVTFSITTRPVPVGTTVTITAAYGGGAWAALLSVQAAALDTLTLAPTSLLGGTAAVGTVTLNGPAPAGGAAITLTSANTVVATVPSGVTVPAGATSATFAISGQAVRSSTAVGITASYAGVTRTAAFTAVPPVLTAISLNPNLVSGGVNATGSVTLSGIAPPGGASVILTSDDPAASVPTSVTIPAGATSAPFPVSTTSVSATQRVTFSASFDGMTRTATLTILPVSLQALTLQPASVTGGLPSVVTITLTGPAPAGGVIVALTGDNSAAAAVPESVTVPAGSATATATVATLPLDATANVTVTATLGGITRSAPLLVTATPRLTLTLDRTSVTGGASAVGTVTLSNLAPAGGATIALTRSSSVAILPGIVTLPAGASTTIFPVGTQLVTSTTAVTLTASYAGRTATATLTVVPDVPAAPAQLIANAGSSGRVTLTWIDTSANETVFEIERQTGSAGFVRIGSVSANTTLWRETGLTAATLYTYRVRAVNASGASAYSNEAPVTTLPALAPLSRRQIAVFRPATGEWFVRKSDGSARVTQFGVPGDQPVPADYLGTGETQIAVLRPGTHQWFLRRSDGSAQVVQFGEPGDIPVPADFFGFGYAQFAVYRPATGEWFLRTDEGGTVPVSFVAPGGVPVPADYAGLGRAQIAVFRPETREWFLRTDSGGAITVPFGGPGDLPVPGDYLGLGHTQVAVFRPGTSEWFVRDDRGQTVRVPYGMEGAQPVPGDYRGLGTSQLGIFLPDTREWFVRAGDGTTTVAQWGGPGDVPVPLRLRPGMTTIRAESVGWNAPNAAPGWVAYYLDNREIYRKLGGDGVGRGFTVVRLDPTSGIPLEIKAFNTWNNSQARAALLDYLARMEAGSLVAIMVGDDAGLTSGGCEFVNDLLVNQIISSFESKLGSTKLRALCYRSSWAIIGRWGSGTPIAEGADNGAAVSLEIQLPLP